MTRITLQALNKSYGQKRPKRCIFSRLRKAYRDGADVTWHGSSFQVGAAATGKARLPTVKSRVPQINSDAVSAEVIPRSVGSLGWRSSSARYVSAVLYVRTANLNWIHSGAFNQWRSEVMWCDLDDENTSRMAEFITNWSHLAECLPTVQNLSSVIYSRVHTGIRGKSLETIENHIPISSWSSVRRFCSALESGRFFANTLMLHRSYVTLLLLYTSRVTHRLCPL